MKCTTNNCTAKGSVILEQFGNEVIRFTATGKKIDIDPPSMQQKQVIDMIKSVCIYDNISNGCDTSVNKYF